MRKPTFSSARQHDGFTLVELVITLSISAILIAMAVPAMAGLVTRSAVRSTEDALFTAAHMARIHAITHNTDALLCPSADGQHCSDDPAWQQGWIVALDTDHDGQPNGAVLAHHTPDNHSRIVGSSGRDHVRFRPNGAASGTNLTLVICPHQHGDAAARVVIVSNAGRIREARADSSQRARCKMQESA